MNFAIFEKKNRYEKFKIFFFRDIIDIFIDECM